MVILITIRHVTLAGQSSHVYLGPVHSSITTLLPVFNAAFIFTLSSMMFFLRRQLKERLRCDAPTLLDSLINRRNEFNEQFTMSSLLDVHILGRSSEDSDDALNQLTRQSSVPQLHPRDTQRLRTTKRGRAESKLQCFPQSIY